MARDSQKVFVRVVVTLAVLGALLLGPKASLAATLVAGSISIDTTWEAVGNPFVMSGDVTVEAGVTLTLSAGVIVKADLETELVVIGRLVARGLASAPILLTSSRDDALAGDTNGDGSETSAAAGDWVGIGFHRGGEGSALSFVEIRYAGYYGPTGTNHLESSARESVEATAKGTAGKAKGGSPVDAAVNLRVDGACGVCHSRPPADILPREMWPAEVERMVGLRHKMPFGRTPAFSKREISDWYQRHAPASFVLKPELAPTSSGPLRFERRRLPLKPGGSPHVATVVRLERGTLDPDTAILAVSNMKNGNVHLLSFGTRPKRIGKAGHPVRAVAGDIDADGLVDLIISDVGSVLPTDDPVGRVVVAFNRGDGKFELESIMDGLPRVSDARPVDLDGDGDLDIAVAAFGKHLTGGVFVLRNESARQPKAADSPNRALRFVKELVVARSGAVSLIPVEGLQPGLGTGLVVAFAQEHELVSVFYREDEIDTEGQPPRYREQVLFRAPHPNWGISNLEIADIDGDGDLDFLLAHGDTMDDGFAYKPYHGVDWLENRGEAGFQHHRLGDLYGAHRAEAVDLDGDGDLDVVAGGYLPQVPVHAQKRDVRVESVVWFERRDRLWIPWTIESNHPRHTGLTVIDVNRDGRPDIVGAINYTWEEQAAGRAALEVWINRGPR